MEAKELMHNDLALLNGKIVRFDTYCGFVRLEDGAQFPRSIQVQPIQLTPEILEKNGFDNYNKIYYTKEIALKRHYVGYFFIEATDANIHIYYVHELQRALRCCGLWELAENFKV